MQVAFRLIVWVSMLGVGIGISQYAGDKASGKLPLSAAFHVEVAEEGEDDGTNEVDEEIVHGIDEAEVQVTTNPKGTMGSIRKHKNDIFYVLDDLGMIGFGGV